MTGSVAERYLRLGLRLDRHVEGTVDAYFGPPDLAAEVAAEGPVDVRELAGEAMALLGELPDGWLRDQVAGLRTYAGVLAGESTSYADEVHGCFGVRPFRTDEAVFAEAHDRLEALLSGEGSLAERYERWRRSTLVPAERIESIMAAVIAEARRWTKRLIELPDGEKVALEVVHDQPWNGYNHYLGDLRGRVSVNVDLPMTAYNLLHLTVHETYPGHQAERACKEEALVRGRGLLEETIVLAPTPQSLIAEGIGEIAPDLLLDGDAGAALASIVRDSGVDFDLTHAVAVERAMEPCRWASVNAALLLHEIGVRHETEARVDEVKEYLQRWELLSPEIAGHVIRFMTEPASRTYVFNYPAGRRLCRSYVEVVPDGFRRLLTEQIRVGDLLSAAA